MRPGRKAMRFSYAARALLVLAFVATACGGQDEESTAGQESTAGAGEEVAEVATEEGDSDAASADTPTVRLSLPPSAVPAIIAADQDMFEGINAEVSQIGGDQAAAVLVSGEADVGWIGPLEVAGYVAEGEPMQAFSAAGAQNMINGVVVRSEDASEFQTITDLQGARLGMPGFGSGTWATFEVFARTVFDIEDPRNAFEILTADSGALLAMLETGEIDAALMFSGPSAAARALDQFHTIFSFTEEWQETTGQPLTVAGPVGRTDWIEENPDAVAAVVDGIDAGVAWMRENPEEMQEGGTYEDLAEAVGWLGDPATTEGIIELMVDGQWYLSSDTYTQEWIDATYELIQAGEGSLVDEVPPVEDIFTPPEG